MRDFLDMVSLRILAKGSDTAPFGAVSALLQKDAEKLPYKIHKDFSTSAIQREPFTIATFSFLLTEFISVKRYNKSEGLYALAKL